MTKLRGWGGVGGEYWRGHVGILLIEECQVMMMVVLVINSDLFFVSLNSSNSWNMNLHASIARATSSAASSYKYIYIYIYTSITVGHPNDSLVRSRWIQRMFLVWILHQHRGRERRQTISPNVWKTYCKLKKLQSKQRIFQYLRIVFTPKRLSTIIWKIVFSSISRLFGSKKQKSVRQFFRDGQ